MSTYSVFYQENYASMADRLKTTTPKVIAEMAKAWRALSKEEKNVYVEKAREINRERREKRDAPVSEKKTAK
jgi:DNA-dependent RNA polymerase auxiliary subunit epsilon